MNYTIKITSKEVNQKDIKILIKSNDEISDRTTKVRSLIHIIKKQSKRLK